MKSQAFYPNSPFIPETKIPSAKNRGINARTMPVLPVTFASAIVVTRTGTNTTPTNMVTKAGIASATAMLINLLYCFPCIKTTLNRQRLLNSADIHTFIKYIVLKILSCFRKSNRSWFCFCSSRKE